jgi:hypothetical protein
LEARCYVVNGCDRRSSLTFCVRGVRKRVAVKKGSKTNLNQDQDQEQKSADWLVF